MLPTESIVGEVGGVLDCVGEVFGLRGVRWGGPLACTQMNVQNILRQGLSWVVVSFSGFRSLRLSITKVASCILATV